MVRAKFRCMRTIQHYDGNHQAEFRPVWRHSGPDPENLTFWEATPSGDADIWWMPEPGEAPRFVPGAFYYIDMEQDDDGPWHVSQVLRIDGGHGEVSICLPTKWPRMAGDMHGKLSMNLSRPTVLAMFGDPGTKWSVTFRFAEANTGEP